MTGNITSHVLLGLSEWVFMNKTTCLRTSGGQEEEVRTTSLKILLSSLLVFDLHDVSILSRR